MAISDALPLGAAYPTNQTWLLLRASEACVVPTYKFS